MTEKESIIYGTIALVLALFVTLAIRFSIAKVFYNGDLRCVFAECRINK